MKFFEQKDRLIKPDGSQLLTGREEQGTIFKFNRELKKSIKGMGANKTNKSIDQVSRAEIIETFDEVIAIKKSHHPEMMNENKPNDLATVGFTHTRLVRLTSADSQKKCL